VPGKSAEQIDDEAILMRAYGNNTDILIDRDREAESHALLAKRGLAPPLLARFNNGLLYNFIQGRVCTPQDLIKEDVWRGVARRLAEWHSVPLPESYYSEHRANGIDGTYTNGVSKAAKNLEDRPTPNVWTIMQKWINALPVGTAAEQKRKSQLQTELDHSIAELDNRALPELQPPGLSGMVFGHCDLLSANVIILPSARSTNAANEDDSETVRFIDYEYATACQAAFDIANHFAEWGGYDCDYTMLPDRTTRRSFLEEYLRTLARSHPQEGLREDIVQSLLKQVDDFRGIPGLYWGIWALIQATISQINFDYASYAEVRLGEYFAWREEKDGTRKKHGKEMPLRERCWEK
jgi:ethanolamine kinase